MPLVNWITRSARRRGLSLLGVTLLGSLAISVSVSATAPTPMSNIDPTSVRAEPRPAGPRQAVQGHQLAAPVRTLQPGGPDTPDEPARPDRPDVPGRVDCGARWQQPVAAAIVDWFRPPDNHYGPGNRGLEYATSVGDPVHAVADGTVSFAGPVGGNRFVVIQHGPDIRATYGYLVESSVGVGQTVVAGERVAVAATGFHLTARRLASADNPERGEVYVDPLPLLTGDCFIVRLVPLPGDGLSGGG